MSISDNTAIGSVTYVLMVMLVSCLTQKRAGAI